LIEELAWISIAFFFGAMWGSFANVVIVRLPQGKSVVFPRSHCPKCKNPIPWYLNIPIFSWLILRGRCRQCQEKISPRYPLVEFTMGFFFAAIFYRFGWTFSTLEYFLFAFGLVTSSFIDLDHMILPDRFTLSGIIIGLVGAYFNPDRYFLDALAGVILGGGFLLAIAYFYLKVRKIDGMGGGDIKLLAWIGAVCGVQSILFVLVVSSLLGLIFGLFYIIKSKEGMKTGIPFGPYLSLAALIYLLWGPSLLLSL
jgi:leader peptidase (prepilin peptidase) / N-methyltransferase